MIGIYTGMIVFMYVKTKLCVYMLSYFICLFVLGSLMQGNNRNMGMPNMGGGNNGPANMGMSNGQGLSNGQGHMGVNNGQGGIDFASLMKNMGDFSKVFGNIGNNMRNHNMGNGMSSNMMGGGNNGLGRNMCGNMPGKVDDAGQMAGGPSNNQNQSGI